MRQTIRAYLAEIPGMLPLSILTAVTTLLLIVILSLVLGGASRERNAATRCYAAYTHAMIRDIADGLPGTSIDIDLYPPINLDGLDCSTIFVPLHEAPNTSE